MENGRIVMGGDTDINDLYIAPTLIDGVSPDDPIMQGEIFGPILPIIEYDKIEDAIKFVNDQNKPFGTFIFSDNKAYQQKY